MTPKQLRDALDALAPPGGWNNIPDPLIEEYSPDGSRITFLKRMRETTKADLLMKFENGDYHGVADAAMDLRDIDSELAGLRY